MASRTHRGRYSLIFNRLLAWQGALAGGLDVRWLDHQVPPGAANAADYLGKGLLGNPSDGGWLFQGVGGAPGIHARGLRPVERRILSRKLLWDGEPLPAKTLILDSELEVGARATLKLHLGRSDMDELLWEGEVSAPRNEFGRLLTRGLLSALRAGEVECPEALAAWFTSPRTEAFSAYAHWCEGLASRLPGPRLHHFEASAKDETLWPAAQILRALERHRQRDRGALERVFDVLDDLGTTPWDWLLLACGARLCEAREAAQRALKLCEDRLPPTQEPSSAFELNRRLLATP
ncbi:hypothetical protein JXA47_11170 [Candidatus Sumerlaeota bacterium]|nr:hypothetical protein [Candidatus Sumerlaeota bacterium]